MIAADRIEVVLRNGDEELNMYMIDINDWDDEIEVYSYCRHPNLKRGWVGDLIYRCVRGVNMPDCTEVKNIEVDCIKDVLLRHIQCFSVGDDEATTWKYVFLKD
jgi:hypothetical protein